MISLSNSLLVVQEGLIFGFFTMDVLYRKNRSPWKKPSQFLLNKHMTVSIWPWDAAVGKVQFPPRGLARNGNIGHTNVSVTTLYPNTFELSYLSCPSHLVAPSGLQGGGGMQGSDDPGRGWCFWQTIIIWAEQHVPSGTTGFGDSFGYIDSL